MKKIKIKTKISGNTGSKTATVDIGGELVLKNAHYLHSEILKIVSQSDYIDLVVNNPENLDLSVIQILYSLKSVTAQNKKLDIKLKLSEEQKRLISNAGFKELMEVLC